MLQISNTIQPKADILQTLSTFQKEIDDLTTFEARSKKAKELFAIRNKKGNKVFDAIKVSLLQISPGIERCIYCEDSKCDEVEHIYPKDLYPHFCFLWTNYVYACGTCNGPKNNQFAVFRHDNGQYQEVNPANNREQVSEPPSGEIVLINPRVENPLDFCQLDLETFKFNIIAKPNTKDYKRADYTFNTVLRLNDKREYLRRQRENAYENYKARLHSYTTQKNNGADRTKLNRMIENLKREAHPTVWKEMQRQYLSKSLKDSELQNYFQQSPEALSW
jgi:hypothetical protein